MLELLFIIFLLSFLDTRRLSCHVTCPVSECRHCSNPHPTDQAGRILLKTKIHVCYYMYRVSAI